MKVGYPFDGKKYEKSSQCQREWGTKLAEELHLKGNETILYLGCGNGVITKELAERVPQGRVVGVDSSPSMLEAAKAHKTARFCANTICGCWKRPHLYRGGQRSYGTTRVRNLV